MDLPLVSIVTPSYNSMPYIKATIESIIYQNYPNLEHIIYDGGSIDGTVDLLNSYPNIKWISEKDQGQSHALNKGFQKAKGEIIGWLNADDTYETNAINQVVDFFVRNPEFDIVCTDINIINSEGKIIGFSKGSDFDLVCILTNNMIKQPTLFMRKRVLDELAGLNESYHYIMDQELWLRAGIKGFKFAYLRNKVFANFRFINGTKSFESAPAFHEEWFHVVKDALSNDVYKGLTKSKKKEILKHTEARIYTAYMIKSIENKNRVSLFKNFLNAIRIDSTLLINRGMWKFIFLGILGLEYNLTRKYRKHLNAQKVI